jgi:hypothetical protein
VLQKLLSLLEGDSESKVDDGAGSEDEDEYLDAESDEDGSDEDESSMDTSLEVSWHLCLSGHKQHQMQ